MQIQNIPSIESEAVLKKINAANGGDNDVKDEKSPMFDLNVGAGLKNGDNPMA